ncbi:MAG: carbohydrate ABC transporter permease [Chloroflexia bacterium]|jgi:multiple sugar transport system permease protein|nr:carbohydrate ABC transporter permease [Chloroflexia bacterium]MDQ3613096.1 carbohydrate ABC transporter permease [Chloroflexota bacterium]
MATTSRGTTDTVYQPKRSFFRSRRFRHRIAQAITYTLLLIGSFVMLLPLVWLVRSSFMSLDQIFAFPPEWIPEPWVWQNYPDALDVAPFARYFLNTMVIEFFVVTGTVVSATISAYGFARLRWKGRDQVFAVLMTTMMLPGAVTLIPAFIIWSELGFVNTIVPLTAPAWFGGGMFNIFLLRQFFRGLPRDLDEAAVLDGASPLRILWDVIIPLSRPALITVGIFSFLTTWNDFLGPLIYLNDSRKYTLAIGLSQFKGQYTSEWGLLMAASTLVILPVLILFFVAQRYFVEGIALTGIKG